MKKKKNPEEEFNELIQGMNLEEAIPYSINISFRAGDLIDHTVFGLGKVLECITPDKIVVRFRSAQKILICQLKEEV